MVPVLCVSQVDCVVCPMLGAQPSSLRVGRALQSVAGAALEIRFKQAGGAPRPADTVLVDGLPVLTNAVIFLHLVNYSSRQQERAKQVLRDSIDSALRRCEERGFSSVALPVLGPGAMLQFPLHTAALVLLQEIHTFEKRRAPKTPFLIRIVIHPDDKDASKAFQIAQQTVHLKGFTNYANPSHASFYCHVSSSVSEVSALMGNVKLQIVQGDIIHEKTDIIVNSTGFNKETAGISKAILTAAGPNVKAEFIHVSKTADHLCCTGAGLLGCRKIIHVQTDHTVQGISKNCKKSTETL
ncbi:unnamed protein product [Knipowitschia caucasica]|uniref:Macro domain-containing protein n=1 Tax=Knipowitschia caucasica TaxID=637954 RepID=A0AAV2KQ78_KNICA